MPWRVALGLVRGIRPGLAAGHAVCVLLQAALPLFGLLAMRWFVDAIVAASRDPAAGGFASIAAATGLAAGVAAAGHLLRGLGAVWTEAHGRAVGEANTDRLQRHAASLDLAAFDRADFHDLLHRATAEAGTRPVRFAQDLIAAGAAALGFVSMALLLAGAAGWLPCLVALAAVPGARLRLAHARERFDFQSRNAGASRELGYLGGVLTGRATAKDLRALGLTGRFVARAAALRERLGQGLGGLARSRARAELAAGLLATSALFLAYLHLGDRALAGALTIGGVVLHAQAAQRAQNGVRDLLAALAALGEDRLFLRPVVDFLALEPGLRAEPPVVEIPPGRCELSLEDLAFSYPDSPGPALQGVSTRLPAGEFVVVAGHNGSGKSTLVKLLCRLYDPTTGCIRAGGIDLHHVEPTHWRTRLAVLFQDAHGFEATLRDNLAFGNPSGLTEEAAYRALAVVGLEARVRALPQGLDTPLSRREAGGIELSGGELRRLLLARALAAPADVLLLDEPFAHLDAETTKRLGSELRARAGRQTVIVADHRAAALAAADRVLLLEAGRLVAQGTPADLARGEPRFRGLAPPG